MVSKLLALTPLLALAFAMLLAAVVCVLHVRKLTSGAASAIGENQRLLSKFIVSITTSMLFIVLLDLVFNALFYCLMLSLHGQGVLKATRVKDRERPGLLELFDAVSYVSPRFLLVGLILWPLAADIAESAGISRSGLLKWRTLWVELGSKTNRMLERLLLMLLLVPAAMFIAEAVGGVAYYLAHYLFYEYLEGHEPVNFLLYQCLKLMSFAIALYPFVAIGFPLAFNAFQNLGVTKETLLDILPRRDEATRVYISYAWSDREKAVEGPLSTTTEAAITDGDHSAQEKGDGDHGTQEELVERLHKSLSRDGYNVWRDKTHLPYRGRISEFMTTIGRGTCIITIIGDKYLRSLSCMTELLEVYRNNDFHKRICPVVLSNAKIHSLESRVKYVAYWTERNEITDREMSKSGLNNFSTDGSLREAERIRHVRWNADLLLAFVADMNTLTPSLIESNNFEILKQAIDERLELVNQIS